MRDPGDEDLADSIADEAAIAAARRRAAGLYDAEQRKRRVLAEQLVEELRRPLVQSHPPSNLESIATVAPRTRPAR